MTSLADTRTTFATYRVRRKALGTEGARYGWRTERADAIAHARGQAMGAGLPWWITAARVAA